MIIIKTFKFDAAHNLTKYRGKCEKLHGHTYKLVVKLEGYRDEDDMIFDFVELKRLVNDDILSKFDHSYINDFIENPTAENIAVYIWDRLEASVKRENCSLYEIEVWETETSGVIYNGK